MDYSLEPTGIASFLWHFVPSREHLATFALYLLIFSPLELLIPAHRGRKLFRAGWATDLLHFLFNIVPIGVGIAAIIGGATALGHVATPDVVTAWLSAQPLWLQVLLGTILADLFFYFGHRMLHEVPWLWDFHAIHHSSEELDWLAAFRVHPVDQIIERGTALIPIFVLGFSTPAIVVIAVIYQWQALFIHSNVQIPFGWLKWLVATPQFHHWHHSNEAEGHNKNFSGQLPLWDIIFGTAHLPAAMPKAYGISEPVSGTYLAQLLHPLKRIAGRLRRKRPDLPPARPSVRPAAPAVRTQA